MNMAVSDALEARIRAGRLLTPPVTWQDELVFPAFDGLSILNASSTLGAALGVDAGAALDEAVWQGASPLGRVDRAVVFITDGLGYHKLNQLVAADPTLANLVDDVGGGRMPVPLSSVSPSTTVAALSTLFTARAPASHGILGTTVQLYPLNTVVDMLAMASVVGGQPGNIAAWGVPPIDLIQGAVLPENLTAAGVQVHLVVDDALLGSGFSSLLYRGFQHLHGVHSQSHWGTRLRQVLRQTRGQRALVIAYLSGVDLLSHLYGADSEEVHAEVRLQLSVLREALARPEGRDGRTLVMMLADHGHQDAPQQIDFSASAAGRVILDAQRGAYTGDQRFAYLHLREGQRSQVEAALREAYADVLAWFTPAEALQSGVFGAPDAVHPQFAHRAGDLILVPRAGHHLKPALEPADPRRRVPFVSFHAGLSAAEMLVPLLWQVI
jgi:hypothetical protein